MAEHMDFSELDSRYGKKGVVNTALATGIIGTVLGSGMLKGGLGGIFGGCQTTTDGLTQLPSIWTICEKQNNENVAITAAMYQGRIQEMKDLADVYERINKRLVEVEKKDAALEASLPLAMQLVTVNAERYADNKVSCEAQSRERMDSYLQNELSKKIDGQLGLPFSSIITGIPTLPPVQYCVTGCNCPK